MTPQAVLAQTLKLPNGVVVKNRLFKPSMSESLGTRQGAPTPELNHLYQAWAEGGIGLCVTGIKPNETSNAKPQGTVGKGLPDKAASGFQEHATRSFELIRSVGAAL